MSNTAQNGSSPHLTIPEVAARFRCSRISVVRNWRDRWKLRPLRVGNRLLFPISQIEEFERRLIETGERGGGQ